MTDEIADVAAPVADTPAPSAAPEKSAEPPSRRDAIVAAVEAQKERAATADTEQPAKAAAPVTDRARAPDGKFVPATDKPAPDRTAREPGAEDPEKEATPETDILNDNQFRKAVKNVEMRAPGSWSPVAKVAYDTAHPAIKDAIYKREQEYARGIEKYAALRPVEKYVEMARNSGTTLDRALENYVGIEQLLKRDVFAGFEQIAKNTGVNLRSFATAYLQKFGQGGQNAGQDTAHQAHQPAAVDPQAIVNQAKEAVRAEYEARQVESDVRAFAADHKNRFYENVKPQMAKLVQTGMATTIQEAYDMACRMDPEISRLINQPTPPDPRKLAVDQARAAARATIGAPANGQSPGKLGLPANATRRQIMQAEIDRQKGARA